MKCQIENFPAVTVAYFRNVGPYGISMSGVWNRLNQWARSRGRWNPSAILYGICHDNPMDTPADQCRYDACVAVPPESAIDQGAQQQQVPGGEYLVMRFHGAPDKIIEGFGQILHDKIPQAGRDFDFTRPVLERYSADFKTDPDGSFSCDLCVPVK